MLSTYAVPGELPARPAPSVAHASTISPRRRLIGCPSGSVRPAAFATPMKVDNESNRSVNMIAIMAGRSASWSAPTTSSSRNTDEKSGAPTICRGSWAYPSVQASAVTTKMAARNASGLSRRIRAAPTTRPSSEERRAVVERAEADERHGVAFDDAGVAQPDERQQQADPAGRRQAQARGYRRGNALPQRRRRDEQEEHSRPEHDAEGHLPRHAVSHDDRVGEEGVQPHAGRNGERQPGVEAHQQRHAESNQHRRREHAGERHAGAGRGENGGFTTTMYDIVKKVVTPPMTSLERVSYTL